MNKEFLDAIEANPIIAAVKFGQGGAYRDLYPVWRYPFYWGNCGADPPGGEDRDGTYRPDHRFKLKRGFCGLYL